MKHINRLLALLLSLVLVFNLALPVFAADDPNPAMPVITRDMILDMRPIKYGEEFTLTLSIEAEIPNGDPIAYQWYCGIAVGLILPAPIPGATTSSCTVEGKGSGGSNRYYYCVVSNANNEMLQVSSHHNIIMFEPKLGVRIFQSVIRAIDKILRIFGVSFSLYDLLFTWFTT